MRQFFPFLWKVCGMKSICLFVFKHQPENSTFALPLRLESLCSTGNYRLEASCSWKSPFPPSPHFILKTDESIALGAPDLPSASLDWRKEQSAGLSSFTWYLVGILQHLEFRTSFTSTQVYRPVRIASRALEGGVVVHLFIQQQSYGLENTLQLRSIIHPYISC
jgi:hypothetical protein